MEWGLLGVWVNKNMQSEGGERGGRGGRGGEGGGGGPREDKAAARRCWV